MSLKTIVFAIVIIAAGIGIFEGAPQKAWEWFKGTELAEVLYSGAGEQSLPGPLRGLIDPNINSNLTVGGVVEETNNQRDANGLGPLHKNDKLALAAEAKIDDMFAQQYFEHRSPDGKSPADIIRGEGYEYIVVGENLALGNFRDDETLVQAWMDSPGHRANILNSKYQEIGVAVRKGEFEGKTVWLAVQEFGAPLSSCPSPGAGLKGEIDSNRTSIASLQTELQQQKRAIDNNQYSNENEYNKAVARYNDLAHRINELTDATQALVRDYNQRVNGFNECLESNS